MHPDVRVCVHEPQRPETIAPSNVLPRDCRCRLDKGPLTAMDAVELQHWMRIAATRAAVSAVVPIQDMVDKSQRRITEGQRKFEVRF